MNVEIRKAIKNSLLEDDFNNAIIILQEAIGQDDGGNASIFFSEFQDDNGEFPIWNDKTKRLELIFGYLRYEKKAKEFFEN